MQSICCGCAGYRGALGRNSTARKSPQPPVIALGLQCRWHILLPHTTGHPPAHNTCFKYPCSIESFTTYCCCSSDRVGLHRETVTLVKPICRSYGWSDSVDRRGMTVAWQRQSDEPGGLQGGGQDALGRFKERTMKLAC